MGSPDSIAHKFNVFAGSEIGYLKGINFGQKSFSNLNKVEKLNKKLGINCLCWGANDESVIYAGCKGGDVFYHNVKTGINQCVVLEHKAETIVDNLKQICVHDNKIITGFHKGTISVHKVESEGSLVTTSRMDQIMSFTTNENFPNKSLLCMDHNKSETQMLATGGLENPLTIWDINNLSGEPVFAAKNVKHDWLDLRVPIWVTGLEFYPQSNKVITGTGKGKLRMYDPSTPQRRPVIEVDCDEYPVTALAVRPQSDFQVFVGNTIGTLRSVDLRKKAVLRGFKGVKGGITDIKCHPQYPVFAVCSVDRYVRCYDPDQKDSLLHSFYVNSSLKSILFSSKWDKEDYSGATKDDETSENKTKGDNESCEKDTKDNSDDEGDDVWNELEVVKKKRRKE